MEVTSPLLFLDPRELERFASPHGDEDEERDISDELVERARQRAKLQRAIQRIPQREAEIVAMRLQGTREEVIAEHYGCTQQAVSLRYHRAIERLRWLARAPEVPEQDLRKQAAKLGLSGLDADILAAMAITTSQAETARRLGVPRITVWRRFTRAVEAFEEGGWRYKRTHALLVLIRENPNILCAE